MLKHEFVSENWLLYSEAAEELYHTYAAPMPIVDYHNHLSPEDVATNHSFANVTEAWLKGDHYKWRAMRAAGVNEALITGGASDREKFDAWAAVVPQTLCNPLYHWTHMELKRPFGLSDTLLNSKTADKVWSVTGEKLADPSFSVQGLLSQFQVRLICTTDDPVDSLEHHQALANDPTSTVRMLPAWRPDKGMAIEQPKMFNPWIDQLGAVSNVDISDFDSYMTALNQRHSFFHERGCRLSDHGLSDLPAAAYHLDEVKAIFARVRAGGEINPGEVVRFKSAMLHELAVMDHAKGWTQQFHIGALRNTNRRMLATCGPDSGFDSIDDPLLGRPLSRFLNRLDSTDQLAPTILYNLNPRDNELMATMIGNYQDGSKRGKMQFGSGWWFLDQLDGMEKQMTALSNLGLLSCFVGMLTDSRSFLSFSRHEYFRRILCNMLGHAISKGHLPDDRILVGDMVRDICYRNAVEYFNFPVEGLMDGIPLRSE